MQTLANLQCSGLSPVTVGGTGAAIKYFPMPVGTGIGIASTAVGFVPVPGSSRANGQVMRAIASGNYSTPAGTVLVTLNANTAKSGATPVYVILATTAAITPTASTLTSWALQSDLIGDSGSGVVYGTYRFVANSTAGGPTVQVAAVTGINFASEWPFSLAVGVTFGTSAAANTANLYNFVLEG